MSQLFFMLKSVLEPEGRPGRQWTCWCAIHRPQAPPDADPLLKNIIIMEFEFERDKYNPLYPPPSTKPPTGTDSGGSGKTSTGDSAGGSTDDSQETLMSLPGTVHGEGSTPSLTTATSPFPKPLDGESEATSPPDEVAVAPDALHQMQQQQQAKKQKEEIVEWQQSVEDIIESTTSASKPLPALERLRRMAYGDAGSAATTSATADTLTTVQSGPGSVTRTRRGRGSTNTAGRGVGMMDVFAVMAQINEQLGAASDLETFLKVLVGVIKDLTQFHRVLAYQFDEMWNGKVVAELVDWSVTQDLYRGLHFPAADIPAQVNIWNTIH
jgi:hypothetical protein